MSLADQIDAPAAAGGQPPSSFSYEDLIAMANGKLANMGDGRLPLPPMLMFDRITQVDGTGGEFGRGKLVAELDVRPELWFFACHFHEDPVMPGCLGLDAMWQLVGFYLCWLQNPGRGRALGVGEVKFSGQVLPEAKLVRYEIDVKRVIRGRLAVGLADGTMAVDGEVIYRAKDLKVGLFGAGAAR